VRGRKGRTLELERALAFGSGLLFVVTLIWKDWIELVFHVDPDRGNGALEWAITLAFAALTVVFATLGRRAQRRL
jgi:hypothetical protein